ncbi:MULTISPECIES: ABC transporter substrate-binding protein [Roseobacteraceae]|uniref:ABC transporter substrate-binding protein n=1 Tax=Roseobacteraceae TaxID=2854170 RepID=UPI001C43745E|nr:MULTISPECIES: ABC transporter substrate-binding protein [Roseobacteraceae]MBV7409004.1 ABC transporter substrate-binding protein [Maritimibacter sp. DP1N21-5]MBY5934309.1 ABC transporter substrate-binding protein [Tateyamaria omphalii]
MSNELKHLSAKVAAGTMTRRDFMARAAALGISAAAATSMLATPAKAAPVAGGTFKMGVQGGESTNSQDPATWASDVPIAGGQLWGEGLVEVEADGSLTGLVAESWEGSADAKTWRFKVRQGITFSNGQAVTAEDVMKTMERHSNEESKSGALGIVQGIESMRTDGDVFEVTLAVGNADLPYLMADYHLMIQPGGGFDDPAAAIGTGAYTLESDEPGVRMVAKRRDDYWGGDQTVTAHYDTVEVIVLNDATARTAALQSGQVDTINRVEPKIAKLLDRAPTVDVLSTAGRGHYVFIMHIDTAPFDENELRLALKHALNREEMVEKILQGYGSIGNDMPINAAYPLFDDTIPQRTFDLEKAAEHYKKSGHDGSPIILRTADGAFPGAVDAAALFQQSCQAAGIPLEIKREPNDGYWSEVWNVQPFCCSYWGGRPVQDQMYTTAYLSTADWNDTRWKRPEFDAMLLEARAELDEAKRKEIYSKMGRMLNEEGGLMVPMFNDFVDAVSTKVQGWESDPNGPQMNWYAFKKTWKA